MRKNKRQKISAGFTLIEILVTLFIIGIISTLMFANYSDDTSQTQLDIKANSLVSDLRLAQSYALNAQMPQSGTSSGWTTIPSGWGVYFLMHDPSFNLASDYQIYANSATTTPTGVYGQSSFRFDWVALGSTSSIITNTSSAVTSYDNTVLTSLLPSCSGGNTTSTSMIVFFDHAGGVWVNSVQLTGYASSCITMTKGSLSKTININSFGLIQ